MAAQPAPKKGLTGVLSFHPHSVPVRQVPWAASHGHGT